MKKKRRGKPVEEGGKEADSNKPEMGMKGERQLCRK